MICTHFKSVCMISGIYSKRLKLKLKQELEKFNLFGENSKMTYFSKTLFDIDLNSVQQRTV